MGTQGVALHVSPTTLLTRCASHRFAFALDGGDERSWGLGHALLGFEPRATLQVMATGEATVHTGDAEQHWVGHPFALLERFCSAWMPPGQAAEPFAGGVVAALSYDLRHWVERLPRRTCPSSVSILRPCSAQAFANGGGAATRPVLHAAFYDWVLAYSYADRRYRLASSQRSAAELAATAQHLEALAAAPAPWTTAVRRACAVPDIDKEAYVAAVRRALDYIGAGDVYQINLAQRFVATDPPAAAALFAAMQRHPMPFAAYVDGGDFVLISNSPECFLTQRRRTLSTFPIKGTCRRGRDMVADAALAMALQHDPKERAEHVMIVDLERNDLGRVCRTGSVRVEEFERVHTFPSLHHMVSTISGELRAEVTLADVLRATFPGGSITGAPKIRAMQIIDELEPVGRGFYTGAIGFIGANGDAVFNLAIRTAVAAEGRVAYHAGGAIVADSIPEYEYAETLLKAQPFFAALSAGAV